VFSLSEYLLYGVSNRLRVQMAVTPPHGFSLVADKLVNDPLVYSFVRQSGNEAVPQHMITF